jgi:hypothetical protein
MAFRSFSIAETQLAPTEIQVGSTTRLLMLLLLLLGVVLVWVALASHFPCPSPFRIGVGVCQPVPLLTRP